MMGNDYDTLCIYVSDSRKCKKKLSWSLDQIIFHENDMTAKQSAYIIQLYAFTLDSVNDNNFKISHLKQIEEMQHRLSEYNPDKHLRLKALSIKNPWAELIAQDKKTIEVRPKRTNYRGDIVICSSAAPVIKGMTGGAMLAIAELYEVKPLKNLTKEEWELTFIPKHQRNDNGYGWFIRNVRRVVEYPVKGQLGIWNLVINKDELIVYNDYYVRNFPEGSANYKPTKPFDADAVRKGCFIIIGIFVLIMTILFVVLRTLLG